MPLAPLGKEASVCNLGAIWCIVWKSGTSTGNFYYLLSIFIFKTVHVVCLSLLGAISHRAVVVHVALLTKCTTSKKQASQ